MQKFAFGQQESFTKPQLQQLLVSTFVCGGRARTSQPPVPAGEPSIFDLTARKELTATGAPSFNPRSSCPREYVSRGARSPARVR